MRTNGRLPESRTVTPEQWASQVEVPRTQARAQREDLRSRQRKRLLGRCWPLPLIGLAGLWGALEMGLPGAMMAAGFGTFGYALGSRVASAGAPV